MNETDSTITLIQIDRLVDGELRHDERRQFISQLEQNPHEWRNVALAFVEAQVWSQEFQALQTDPGSASTTLMAQPGETRTQRGRFRIPAFVASVLLSLALGVVLGTAWWNLRHQPARTVNNRESPIKQNLVGSQATAIPSSVRVGANIPPTVRLVTRIPGEDQSEEVDIPIIEVDDPDPNWFEQQQSAFPPSVRRVLERMGLKVTERRKFYPVDLGDGRTAVVPVENVEVRFVGHRGYQ